MAASPPRRPRPARRRRLRRGDDRGFALLESLFVIPFVFTVLLAAVQLGEWWYARQLALTTAQEGARTARAYDGTDAAGEADATRFLGQVDAPGGRILLDPTISVQRSATTVTVRVHGHVPMLLPLLPSTVDEQATGPRETFMPPP